MVKVLTNLSQEIFFSKTFSEKNSSYAADMAMQYSLKNKSVGVITEYLSCYHYLRDYLNLEDMYVGLIYLLFCLFQE